MINIDEIKQSLKTRQIGKRIFFHEETDSTNIEAQRLIDSSSAKFGDLIIAKVQTSGKGQQDNKWASPEGGLYISIITASKTGEYSNLITFAAGIACVEAINSLAGIKAELKWINDIMYNRKKLGGILTQSTTRGDVSTNVIGIGINANAIININNRSYDAVSLVEITGYKTDINKLTAEICNYFEKYFNVYQQNSDLIGDSWLKYSNIKNLTVDFKIDDREIKGIVEGINKYGHMIIRDEHKTEYKLTSSKNVRIYYNEGKFI